MILLKNIDSSIRFFLYVLIFWLPYSPAVIEVCVVISLFLWILKHSILFLNNKTSLTIPSIYQAYSFKKTNINIPIVIFVIACLISVFNSVSFGKSFYSFFSKTIEWFIIFFLLLEVFTEKKHIFTAIFIFLITSFATGLDSIYQYFFSHKDIFYGRIIEHGGRATAAFRTPNGLGAYLSVVIPFSVSLIFIKNKSFLIKIFLIILIFILSLSLFITFSRGAFLGTLLGLFFLFVSLSFFKIISKKALILIISLLFIVPSLIVIPHITKRDKTISWRLDIWKKSISMIKERPLFGYGINTYMREFQPLNKSNETKSEFDPTYAHNCYIQIAFETGLFGLMSFMIIIFMFFKEGFKKINNFLYEDYVLMILLIGFMAGILSFLVHSFFDTNFYSLQLSNYLWAMIGVSSAIMELNTNKNQRKLYA